MEVLSDNGGTPAESLVQIIDEACRTAVDRAGIDREVEFACLLTDGPKIRRLNRRFRSIDRETNVLAFPSGNGRPGGDIAIALDQASAAAAANDTTLETEVGYLAVHAALHLLGHDHHTGDEYRKMCDEEDAILFRIGLASPRGSQEAI